jgi:hypothetical protein
MNIKIWLCGGDLTLGLLQISFGQEAAPTVPRGYLVGAGD